MRDAEGSTLVTYAYDGNGLFGARTVDGMLPTGAYGHNLCD